MIWFTSDTHFGHRRMIEAYGRPFEGIEHMERELIDRWAARVCQDDHVFHLGDFSMGSKTKIRDIVAQLPGRKAIVLGNHDSRKAMRESGFEMVIEGALTLTLDGHRVYLRHVPFPREMHERDEVNVSQPAKTSVHFCGHVHARWKSIGRVVNVGVDVWDFAPVSLDDALAEAGID